MMFYLEYKYISIDKVTIYIHDPIGCNLKTTVNVKFILYSYTYTLHGFYNY